MLTFIKPGLQTTIQDLGRIGFQKYGVIVSGAMDSFSHRIANLLVGNPENEATVEITMIGPVIQFEKDTLIALCGGDLSATMNGAPIGMWRPIYIRAGSVLKFGRRNKGCRMYLAVAGGLHVSEVMRSKSTYIRAEIGGFKGRAMLSGDRIEIGGVNEASNRMIESLKSHMKNSEYVEASWSISPKLLPDYQDNPLIRVVKGRQFHLFEHESREAFFQASYQISTQSDRMGYRLNGPSLKLTNQVEMLSEGVTYGTIQVPANGQPIILMADHQTTGGYPKIGQIASVDLPVIAQTAPGSHVKFTEIDHRAAERLYIEREQMIAEMKQSILVQGRR
ncbi:biotin-dependent carboxyltransferase family protein [Bacillus sp. PS06]|uniref:5-oxoprolinase subunit C family protein n=1 Tax=Bacillus sp. PS06 TaxID=2764176 RepID=UPI0017864C3F|nr:biotin-dependent carboxyltransferase family protein [Bacillus sp. PS06]MBD8071365.1 biotin-dependent carboxyltransferase [Bacillus sp. PS06]